MTELRLSMEMEKIDLVSKIEAFNKKASLVGVEPINISGDGNDSADTNSSQVGGKVFQRLSHAEEYLQKMGWERVTAYSKEFMKDQFIARVEYTSDCMWEIQVM